MRLTPLLCTFALATGGVSSAATTYVSNWIDTSFVSPVMHTPLGSSFVAKIGFVQAGTVLTPDSTFSEINASWTNAGNIAFASPDVLSMAGYFEGQANYTDALGLGGKDIYIWVTNGSDQNAVLRHRTADFKFDLDIPNVTLVFIESSTISSDFELLLGTYNPNLSHPESPAGAIILVPEPSALLLGALGAIGLIRRRR